MDDVLTLVAKTVTSYDDNGNAIYSTTERDVFCRVFGVSRNEFYSAATNGLKPEITARLSDHADYEGEKEAIFHDESYDIIRVYRDTESFGGNSWNGSMEVGNIELTLQKKVRNG